MRFPVLAALLALSPVACNQDSSPAVGTPLTVPLVTVRDHLEVGTVTVSNSEATLRVEIVAAEGWTLEKVRVAAATSLDGIPQTRQGQPCPEKFCLRSKLCSVPSVKFQVPLVVDPGTVLFFAVQAEVRNTTKDAHDCGMESAWASGTPFPKKPEAMYFTYTIQANRPPNLEKMYRTHTQDQWGGDASGLNAPAYLAANFARAFPNGAMIGFSPRGFTATFTSAAAVDTFLADSGPTRTLNGTWIDPTSLKNTFAGETLALTLNVGFDDFDHQFSAGVEPLGNLVVADPSSACFGLSVREVLDLANRFLAGFADPLAPPTDQILDSLHRINANFQDAAVDLGFLGFPAP